MYGLGLIALALICFAWATFDPGQPVPKIIPERTAFAYGAAAFMLGAGAAVQWRRTAARAGAALAVYFGVIVVLLLNGRVVLAHPLEYGAWDGAAEQLAIAAGALLIYAVHAGIDDALALRLTRLGQIVFGLCAVLFGGAHFVYLNLTASLVPSWLPPGQSFWAYATGSAQIAAGLALVSGIQARLAALLLTILYASFTPLVHVPLLLSQPADHYVWSENALNLLLTGAAWVVADSLSSR
jgi:uncharacterized membrane protein YphA (DoxX/SURF4 family)